MARYRDSVCRLCRREGECLYLKGDRCYSNKCAIQRRNYPPGQHGQRRGKLSDYGIQLREKQKVKRIYGLVEKQFRGYFFRAEKQKGITGENLLRFLERRLDNVVFRMGLASSRPQARQLVRHGHILVNDRKVNIPSYLVNIGDVIKVREKSREMVVIKSAVESAEHRGMPPWVAVDKNSLSGSILSLPTREEIPLTVNEQLIVELYSK